MPLCSPRSTGIARSSTEASTHSVSVFSSASIGRRSQVSAFGRLKRKVGVISTRLLLMSTAPRSSRLNDLATSLITSPSTRLSTLPGRRIALTRTSPSKL
ncbi:hypothetical protein D3C72_1977890 [compost metagenome]